MNRFQRVTGVIQTRRHMPLKDGADSLDGQRVELEALWQIEDEDSRYPGEWALGPADEASRVLLRSVDLGWIASGDVQFS